MTGHSDGGKIKRNIFPTNSLSSPVQAVQVWTGHDHEANAWTYYSREIIGSPIQMLVMFSWILMLCKETSLKTLNVDNLLVLYMFIPVLATLNYYVGHRRFFSL